MRQLRYLLSPQRTLIVRGPASVRIMSGEATALGAPLSDHNKTIISYEKQLPIESMSQADLHIILGDAGQVTEVEGSTIPYTWRLASRALMEMHEGIIAVIGGTDVGKSTFCTYIGNLLLRQGLPIRIIDADIGQADIGPPGTISCAAPTEHFTSLADLQASRLMFVGHVTPNYVEPRIFSAIQRLVDIESEPKYITLINTDGWIDGSEAMLYKIQLVSSVNPDLLIGISADTELHPILSMTKVKSMILQAPRQALERSRSDRRAIRQSKYRRFLENGGITTMSRSALRIHKPREFPPLGVDSLNPEFRNLLVGLSDTDGFLIQIGILKDLDERSLHIFSRPTKNVRSIELGYIHLLPNGTELGYVNT